MIVLQHARRRGTRCNTAGGAAAQASAADIGCAVARASCGTAAALRLFCNCGSTTQLFHIRLSVCGSALGRLGHGRLRQVGFFGHGHCDGSAVARAASAAAATATCLLAALALWQRRSQSRHAVCLLVGEQFCHGCVCCVRGLLQPL